MLVLLAVEDAPSVVDGEEILFLQGGFGESFSGRLVRLVVYLSFAEGRMIWMSPGDVCSLRAIVAGGAASGLVGESIRGR